ncbi:hypothetical protein [Robertkochia flava]|uniref:hypothetical protein n=1 Tax=Robertkochia flava TaxID=3447986 RepID=UPI001CC950AF|nr:hypothetical protein [Robertkochia marina]
MERIFFLLFACGFILPGWTQNPPEKDKQGSWQVHKEFDENGNLIRYDSVYRYTSDDASEQFSQEMIDSLFKGIPEMLDPISRDMEEFFKNDPFFSQIFGADSLHPQYDTPYSMEELEDYLRNDSLWIDQSDIDQLVNEMERLRQEFLRQMRGQPKVPASENDSLRKF